MTFPSFAARAALLGAGLSALAAAPARGQGVAWFTDYGAARREAHDKGLPLVIDFSTDNCHFCQMLETITFRDPAVVKLVGDHFVALHLHVGAGGGKEAASLANTLGVEGFPTLIFADPNGKVVGRNDGYMKPSDFVQKAQRVLAALPPPADPAVQQAVHLTAPPAEGPAADGDRAKRAARLLTLLQADYRERQYMNCLERCRQLRADYADTGEAAEAGRIEDAIRADPDVMRLACDSLTDRLGEMYLELADAFQGKGQTQKAVVCLEWVIQACPGTPVAETARGRLARLRDQPAVTTEMKKPAP